jgi:hypothetical protein
VGMVICKGDSTKTSGTPTSLAGHQALLLSLSEFSGVFKGFSEIKRSRFLRPGRLGSFCGQRDRLKRMRREDRSLKGSATGLTCAS